MAVEGHLHPSPRAAGPLLENESEVADVLCRPFPPEVPGGLALSPCVPLSLAMPGRHPLGRTGQRLLMSRGPCRMDAGVSSPLEPSCPAPSRNARAWLGRRGGWLAGWPAGPGAAGPGSTLTWALVFGRLPGLAGALGGDVRPSRRLCFAHCHLRFPRDSLVSQSSGPCPLGSCSRCLRGVSFTWPSRVSHFPDGEPLTARSVASVTQRDRPSPSALVPPARATLARRWHGGNKAALCRFTVAESHN